MLSIRLSRVGTKNAPSYRIVVMPKQRDPWAKVTEIIGHYNPRRDPKVFEVKADRVKHWLSKGAEATDTVWNLLVEYKIVEGKKRNVSTISDTRREKMAKHEEEAKAKEAEAKAKAEEAKLKAEEEAKAQAEAEAPAEEAAPEAPAEEPKAEEPKEEVKEEAPAEEPKEEEKPAEEPAPEAEEKKEE